MAEGAWLYKYEKGQFNIRFDQVRVEDDGLYKCENTLYSRAAEAYLTVFVTPNKMYFDGLKNRKILRLRLSQGAYKLKCVTENGRPPGKITWYKDGVKIKETSSVYGRMPNSKKLHWVNSTVEINPPPRHSTHNYSCSIKTKSSQTPQKIYISVKGISSDQSQSKLITSTFPGTSASQSIKSIKESKPHISSYITSTPPGPSAPQSIKDSIGPIIAVAVGAVVILVLAAYVSCRITKRGYGCENTEEEQYYGDQQFLPYDFFEEHYSDSEEQPERSRSRRSHKRKRKRKRRRSRSSSD